MPINTRFVAPNQKFFYKQLFGATKKNLEQQKPETLEPSRLLLQTSTILTKKLFINFNNIFCSNYLIKLINIKLEQVGYKIYIHLGIKFTYTLLSVYTKLVHN